MTRRELLRHRLIRRRDRLVEKFHDAIEAADRQLDCRELEDGMLEAGLWEAHVLAAFGPRLQMLREVIAALDRLDRACAVCGQSIDEARLREAPHAHSCSDCAITRVMVARAPQRTTVTLLH